MWRAFALILLLAAPAAALDREDQHRAGAAVVLEAAEASGYGYALRDALRSVRRGRSPDAARWAVCWCFEAGRDGQELSPGHDAGCQWFASFGRSVALGDAESRTVAYCAERP